jgi:transposase
MGHAVPPSRRAWTYPGSTVALATAGLTQRPFGEDGWNARLAQVGSPHPRSLSSEEPRVARRVQLRPISDYEGNRLLRIVRRSSGSVVTWRRAHMILLAAQGMPAPRIAEVTFTSEDRVRDVIHNFNTDGFDALYPRYRGGRPPRFTRAQRQQIKKLALSHPQDHDLPFSTWSLAKLADFLVAEGWSRTSATRGCGSCWTTRACRFNA